MSAQSQQPSTEIDDTGSYLLHAEYPIIVWRMPRGALVLGDLLEGPSGWATVVDYYSYNGAWRGSTHYHISYQRFWWHEIGGLDLQCRKLHIERVTGTTL
jgi:hypothetical protein